MAPPGRRPQPPVGTCRLAISGTRNSLPWTNVFYLKLVDDGTQTSADLKSVIDAVLAAWNTNVRPQHTTNVVTTDGKAVWITGVGTALEYEASVGYTGAASTDVNDNAACQVVNWAINQYYRGGHPRTYHPSIVSTHIINGSQVDAATQSNTAAAYTAWKNAVNALTATHISSVALGTVSFARGNVWRTPPVFYAYQSCGVRNFLGTQRRRIGGR
jgi:hypothetical protein